MTKKKHNQDSERFQNFFDDNAPEECQVCGGSLILEKVNLEDYQGGKLYMMEQVPAFACQDCGEVVVPGKIVLEFEQMIATAKQRKTQTNLDKVNPKIAHKEGK